MKRILIILFVIGLSACTKSVKNDTTFTPIDTIAVYNHNFMGSNMYNTYDLIVKIDSGYFAVHIDDYGKIKSFYRQLNYIKQK